MEILLCDDDSTIVGIVRFRLTREGIGNVYHASDGRLARQLLRERKYDLVIMDIHMPYHSGLEIVTFIREEMKSDVPIIILSAEGLEETVLEAFDIGANDFITKPFSPAELVIRVKRLVKKS